MAKPLLNSVVIDYKILQNAVNVSHTHTYTLLSVAENLHSVSIMIVSFLVADKHRILSKFHLINKG